MLTGLLDPDSHESMSQKHTASPLLIVGIATLLGAFSTFQAYQFVRLFFEKPQPLASLIVLNFTFWYGWALLTPAVLWVARRFPLERDTWKRSAVGAFLQRHRIHLRARRAEGVGVRHRCRTAAILGS